MPEEDKAQRWQKIAIDQLGYSLNLTLTYTVAALGYWFTLLKSSDFSPTNSGKSFMLFSLLALGLSAACGFTCVVNRMIDFRGTAKRARGDSDAPTKEHLQGFGIRSWVLFYIHVGGFASGVILMATALLLTYGPTPISRAQSYQRINRASRVIVCEINADSNSPMEIVGSSGRIDGADLARLPHCNPHSS